MKLSKVIEKLIIAKKHYGEEDPELWVATDVKPSFPADLAPITDVGPVPFLDGSVCAIGISAEGEVSRSACPLCRSNLLDRVGAGKICSNGACAFEECW